MNGYLMLGLISHDFHLKTKNREDLTPDLEQKIMAVLKLEGQSTCNSLISKLSAHKLLKKIREMY